MKVKVWKYSVPLNKLDDTVWFEMPACARILSVINQNETLAIYADVGHIPDSAPTRRRLFAVVGTGHDRTLTPAGPVAEEFVGTVQFHGGKLVFHVWDLGEMP